MWQIQKTFLTRNLVAMWTVQRWIKISENGIQDIFDDTTMMKQVAISSDIFSSSPTQSFFKNKKLDFGQMKNEGEFRLTSSWPVCFCPIFQILALVDCS